MPMRPAASEEPGLGVVVIGGDDGGVETGRRFPPVDEISGSGRRCREPSATLLPCWRRWNAVARGGIAICECQFISA